MRCDSMKRNDIANLNDPQLVEYFRDAALRRAKCGFNVTWANKIFDHEMVPAYEALAARGPVVTAGAAGADHDSSLNVREDAAIFAYDLDPSLCRSVLKQLMDEPGWVGIAALAGLCTRIPNSRRNSSATQISIMISINKSKRVAFQEIRQKIEPARPSWKGTYPRPGKSEPADFLLKQAAWRAGLPSRRRFRVRRRARWRRLALCGRTKFRFLNSSVLW